MQGYPYPTPYQQKVCRKMCEKGADLIICQHSHIIGCAEKYLNGTIIYGQGNFLLDESDDENWHSGLILEVDISRDNRAIHYIPTQTQNHKVVIHPDKNEIMNNFAKRSTDILDHQFVSNSFCKISEQKISDYLVKLSGKSKIVQKVFRRIGITKKYKKYYSKDVCNMILDYFYCDSHREAIEYGLNYIIQEKEK